MITRKQYKFATISLDWETPLFLLFYLIFIIPFILFYYCGIAKKNINGWIDSFSRKIK